MKTITCDKCGKITESPATVYKNGTSPDEGVLDLCPNCYEAYNSKVTAVFEEKQAAVEAATTEFIEVDPIPEVPVDVLPQDVIPTPINDVLNSQEAAPSL